MDVESFIRNASEVSLWFSPEGDGDVVNILEVSYLSGSQRKRYCKDGCEFKTFTGTYIVCLSCSMFMAPVERSNTKLENLLTDLIMDRVRTLYSQNDALSCKVYFN